MNKKLIKVSNALSLTEFKHIFKVMKLTSLFGVLCVSSAFAVNVNSQSLRVNIHANQKQAKEVIKQIEEQTDYLFVYNHDKVNLNNTVTIQANDETVAEVLNQMFAGTDIIYAMQGNNILLMQKDAVVQQSGKVVTGTIVDPSGMPVIGANVMVKGTTNGTITDMDGKFSLEVEEGATLQISYIGYANQEIKVGNQKILSIALKEDSKALEELVVVGYGTMRKSDVTGSVKRADLESFRTSPNTNIIQSLQGTVPGLNVGSVNTAGGEPNIEVRGQSTLGGNKDVLIVLDGIVYNGPLSSINPADIASIDVLKDASSKAIYGASAANGVLLITSKKGKKQEKPIINVTSTFASQSPQNMLHTMNREQKIQSIKDYYYQEAYLAPNYTTPNSDFIVDNYIEAFQQDGYKNGVDFDWCDAGSQNSFFMDHQISVSNATDKSQFYISAGYSKQNGYVLNDNFNRKTVRINLDTKVFDWLTVGTQTFGSFMDYSGVSPDLISLRLHSPLLKPYDENGDLIYAPGGSVLANPFLVSEANDYDKRNSISALFFASIDVPFIKGLNYRVNYGNNYSWKQHYYSNEWDNNMSGKAYKMNSFNYDYTIDNILNYKKVIQDKHSIDVTAVIGVRKNSFEATNANGEKYSDISLGYNNLEGSVTQKISSEAWREQYAYQTARFNYNYDNKYLLTATVRRDGFSGFSADKKYGIFPSFALGWVISNEPFFKSKTVDNLKLRLSYGANGNLTSRYSTLAKMGSSSYVFGDGGSTSFGQYVNAMASDLKWETTKGVNVGVDLNMFKNRLNVSAEYYNTNTTDLLWGMQIPTITGFETVVTNIGRINNQGIELSIDGVCVKTRDFSWNIGFNFSKNINRIRELLGDNNGDGREDDLISSKLFIDKSIGTIYDYNVIGIWQLGETPYNGSYIGTEKIEDLNGDGKIDAENDRKYIGSTEPAYRFSISNTFTYKNISLFFFINSVQGGKNGYLGNNNPWTHGGNNSGDNVIRNNFFTEIDYWTPSNPDGEYRIPIRVPSITPGIYRDRSFVRLQDISLRYSFEPSLLQSIGLQALSLSLSAKNLFTITKWKGWDPETGQGLTLDGMPVMRSYSIGLNLTF